MRLLFGKMILLSAVLAACNAPVSDNTGNGEDLPATAVTSEVMALPMIDANKAPVDLAAFKGKKVFLNLWATWCPPCRAEMPSIRELSNAVDSSKVAFVMLSLDENFDLALQYAQKQKLGLPVYYPAASLPPAFQTGSIPATFIFDEEGKLLRKNIGAEDYNTDEYIGLLGR